MTRPTSELPAATFTLLWLTGLPSPASHPCSTQGI